MSYAVGRSVPLQQREASQEKTAENRNVELLASYAAKQRKGTLGVSTGSTVKKAEEVPNTGPILLSLFVEDQNTAIGRRNIHSLKPGYTYTLGGGKSDYLIFLVPMPPHIAEIHCDGNSCTLVPKKPQFFPDIGSQPVPGCIGKTIRVISEKNYELFIRMERYEDPLKSLNRLMNSVEIPK
jgi:hypothetical protein